MKLVFGLSIGFKNGMSWPHCTKTHVLVWVLGNGRFPDQGPIGGAHGAGSPTQQYDFLLSKPWIFQFISCSWSKVIPFLLHILHPYMHRQDFFIYGNLYLSLHYVPLFALLTHSLWLWRINCPFYLPIYLINTHIVLPKTLIFLNLVTCPFWDASTSPELIVTT